MQCVLLRGLSVYTVYCYSEKNVDAGKRSRVFVHDSDSNHIMCSVVCPVHIDTDYMLQFVAIDYRSRQQPEHAVVGDVTLAATSQQQRTQ